MTELSITELTFIFAITVQLVYWLVWLIGVIKIKSTPNTSDSHGVSVIVAVNNELQNLKLLLPLIFAQTYDLFEIIIVDDRSSDGSYEYLQDSSKNNAQLKVLTVNDLPDHLNSKKYALTLGIKSASYDQLLFTDADCRPSSTNWIESFAKTWNENSSFILGFSPYESKPGLLNYFIRFETLLTGIQYLASAAMGKPYMGVGRNLSYSKKLFLSNKGFHGFQNVMGGDDDIYVNKYATSSNATVALSGNSISTSIPKTNLSDYILQKTRHLSAGKHYSFKSKIMLFFFTFTWMLTWALLPFIFISTEYYLLLGILILLRFIIMGIVFYVFSKKATVKFNLLGLILLDFMFALYYFAIGTKTLLTKQVKWK